MSPSSKSESQKDSVLLGSDLKNECRERKSKSRAWVDDSGVKNIACACRGPGFHSQYPHGHSQPAVTLVPEGWILSSGLRRQQAHRWYTYICANTHKIKIFLKIHRIASPPPRVLILIGIDVSQL